MRLHPEIAHVLDQVPAFDPLADPAATRAYLRNLLANASVSEDPRISTEDTMIPGPGGPLPIRIYRPTAPATSPRSAVLFFHGGAFISGDLETGEANCRQICLAAEALVVSVDYRLAPEHPYPAAFDDGHAGLCWLAENAARLDVDADRIAVAGRSAGAAIAAGIALAARDHHGPAVAYQLLLVPALDDRCQTASIDAINDGRIVDGRVVRGMWPLYLADAEAEADQYAAPGRAEDLTGLAPACIVVCQQDPLRDEALNYAQRLIEADVLTEVHLIPGAFHLFEGYAPTSTLARRTVEAWTGALAAALAPTAVA